MAAGGYIIFLLVFTLLYALIIGSYYSSLKKRVIRKAERKNMTFLKWHFTMDPLLGYFLLMSLFSLIGVIYITYMFAIPLMFCGLMYLCAVGIRHTDYQTWKNSDASIKDINYQSYASLKAGMDTSYSSSSSTSSSSQKSDYEYKKCGMCDGTGVVFSGLPIYGQRRRNTCPNCGGKGYGYFKKSIAKRTWEFLKG